jgi:hypothetical protein
VASTDATPMASPFSCRRHAQTPFSPIRACVPEMSPCAASSVPSSPFRRFRSSVPVLFSKGLQKTSTHHSDSPAVAFGVAKSAGQIELLAVDASGKVALPGWFREDALDKNLW